MLTQIVCLEAIGLKSLLRLITTNNNKIIKYSTVSTTISVIPQGNIKVDL